MVAVTIIGITTYILSNLGYVFIIGIAHYEKYGQDPQKRSFQDRLFSFSCLQYVLQSFIKTTLLEFRVLFGPIGNIATSFLYFNYSIALAIPMGFAECILFRCLLVFFWKKFASINDEFFAIFIFMFNLLIICLISIIRLMNGEFYSRFDYDIISGNEIQTSALDKDR